MNYYLLNLKLIETSGVYIQPLINNFILNLNLIDYFVKILISISDYSKTGQLDTNILYNQVIIHKRNLFTYMNISENLQANILIDNLQFDVSLIQYILNWIRGSQYSQRNLLIKNNIVNFGEISFNIINYNFTIIHTFINDDEFNNAINQWFHNRVLSDICYGIIDNWNVINVTNMTKTFDGRLNFNENIGNWNVANVTNMWAMFNSATSFNQNINDWNVENVTNMLGIFYEASSFNQPLNKWKVNKVINMQSAFERTAVFNQNINSWDVSSVTNMTSMFKKSVKFNQPLDNWNVTNVNTMAFMFGDANEFNQNIGNWNVSSVTNMNGMFKNASSFNQNIGNWNVSSVTLMNDMFKDASSLDKDLSNWNVSNLQELNDIFKGTNLSNENRTKIWLYWYLRLSNNTLRNDLYRSLETENWNFVTIYHFNTELIQNSDNGIFYSIQYFQENIYAGLGKQGKIKKFGLDNWHHEFTTNENNDFHTYFIVSSSDDSLFFIANNENNLYKLDTTSNDWINLTISGDIIYQFTLTVFFDSITISNEIISYGAANSRVYRRISSDGGLTFGEATGVFTEEISFNILTYKIIGLWYPFLQKFILVKSKGDNDSNTYTYYYSDDAKNWEYVSKVFDINGNLTGVTGHILSISLSEYLNLIVTVGVNIFYSDFDNVAKNADNLCFRQAIKASDYGFISFSQVIWIDYIKMFIAVGTLLDENTGITGIIVSWNGINWYNIKQVLPSNLYTRNYYSVTFDSTNLRIYFTTDKGIFYIQLS